MKLICIFLLILFPLFSWAQDNEVKNSFSLGWSGSSIARQDLIFSPFVHRDFSTLGLTIAYQRKGDIMHQVEVHFNSLAPAYHESYSFYEDEEQYTAQAHQFTLIRLNYLMGKRLFQNEKIKFWTGGALVSDLQALNYQYGRISYFGYYLSAGLGVFARFEYFLNAKQGFFVQLRLPLVSWMARSPYAINDDEFIENISSHRTLKTLGALWSDGELVSWNSLQYGDIRLNYFYHLSEKWKVEAGYGYSFIHSEEPRPMTSRLHQFQIVGTLNF
ncbi:hypothetical protein WJR50_30010 [Catalinimonas sp. 4WD22]|uniref:hypothetical protein n=1 Tax=Catalinimonas locisalis TaxID=3133978 RepID=UPI003101616D